MLEERRAEELQERLALFERELQVLGIRMEDAARLDEAKLRKIYRARSRELHPDLNDEDDGVEPSIYEINEAYESLKKIL